MPRTVIDKKILPVILDLSRLPQVSVLLASQIVPDFTRKKLNLTCRLRNSFFLFVLRKTKDFLPVIPFTFLLAFTACMYSVISSVVLERELHKKCFSNHLGVKRTGWFHTTKQSRL